MATAVVPSSSRVQWSSFSTAAKASAAGTRTSSGISRWLLIITLRAMVSTIIMLLAADSPPR